jgi:hypothetical protein
MQPVLCVEGQTGLPRAKSHLSVCSDTTGVTPVRTSDVTRRLWAGPDSAGTAGPTGVDITQMPCTRAAGLVGDP